ncbi:MAG TPA: tRNA pseudouridine(38-40) synthase TruA [Gammaproteobacteria bacterium]|jgi:tRNA pseudouridine38-40 synthase|nr:tRNA pseudouridine(38-40) synthase TruA [Gammaproteobacteria bacterium]
MPRFALGVEYDGTEFMGWQRQPHAGRTVQGYLEAALSRVANHPVATVCAGRTDTGVHASAQVVHFDSDAKRELRNWLLGLNANLPADISANWIMPVADDFHARFSARARHYRYTILNRTTRPALARTRATWTHRPLDHERMQVAARQLVGEHDFSAFRALECQAHSPVRMLHVLQVERDGEFVHIDAVANGFLHHMVRNLAGVLMTIGAGKQEPDWAQRVLAGRDRRLGGVTAASRGLCFKAVLYPPHFGIPVPDDALFDRLSVTL